MNDRQTAVHQLCVSALKDLETEGNTFFSVRMVDSLKREIQRMASILDPDAFTPTYGRALLDFDGVLRDKLLQLEYEYLRIRDRKSVV